MLEQVDQDLKDKLGLQKEALGEEEDKVKGKKIFQEFKHSEAASSFFQGCLEGQA